MRKKPVIYNDVWILENWEKYLNWLSLRNEYNRVHDTDIGYTAFKSHCNRKLGLNFMYTKEQKKWLVDNYPNLGRVKAARQFNKVFGTNKSSGAIKVQAQKLGLKVTSNRKKRKSNRKYRSISSCRKRSPWIAWGDLYKNRKRIRTKKESCIRRYP